MTRLDTLRRYYEDCGEVTHLLRVIDAQAVALAAADALGPYVRTQCGAAALLAYDRARAEAKAVADE